MKHTIAENQNVFAEQLKGINRQRIMEVFCTGETVTIADIHRRTDISKPTITKAVQHYCELGVVQSLGLGNTTSAGGKKPELFRFCDERKILCIELWPNSITLALCGLNSDVYDLTAYDYQINSNLKKAFEPLRHIAMQYLQEHALSVEQLYGVALGVPGTVNCKTKLLRYNTHAPGWGNDVDMEQPLREIFGDLPVYYVENAGKATGRAVLLDNAEHAKHRILTVFTTWGVSACLIDRGNVINGRDALIGEIGHMSVSDTNFGSCSCGKRGCLEGLVNLSHMREMLAREGVSSFDGENPVSFRALFAASEDGNEVARKVVRNLAHWFAIALHNLSLAYNQEAVIFQGDYAWADAVFDECLRRELKQFHYYPEGEPFAISYDRRDLSLLAARGSAQPLKDHYFKSIT